MRKRARASRRPGGAGCVFAFLALALVACPLTGFGLQREQQLPPDLSRRAPLASSSLPLPGPRPTVHPPVPRAPQLLWLAPDPDDKLLASVRHLTAPPGKPAPSLDEVRRQAAQAVGPAAPLARFYAGYRLYSDEKWTDALPLLGAPDVRASTLADYAAYYTAVAQMNLKRVAEARKTFHDISVSFPNSFVAQVAPVREAEAAEAEGDFVVAVDIYERLAGQKRPDVDEMIYRAGKAAEAAGDRVRAVTDYFRVYDEQPAGDFASLAAARLELLRDTVPFPSREARLKAEAGRAERLFDASQWDRARAAYMQLVGEPAAGDPEIVPLRLAECEVQLRRYSSARTSLKPLRAGKYAAEGAYYYATTLRALGEIDQYLALVRQMVDQFSPNFWCQEALNGLARFYILHDDDAGAARAYRELLERYPESAYAERAAWRVGWWAYRQKAYEEAARVFERAAVNYPRSDFRPAYLYWAARACERLAKPATAGSLYQVAWIDYQNSYYGRLAAGRLKLLRRLEAEVEPSADDLAPPAGAAAAEVTLPPNHQKVRQLLALNMLTQAMDELNFAARTWGATPAVEATIAWVHHEQGELRKAITSMKRAYPQFISRMGKELPLAVWRILYPLDYWDTIRKHARRTGLDPYLVAALIQQESTFSAIVRSSANAYGLMQIVPATGRRLARAQRVRRFSTLSLLQPDTNVRLGTTHFADLLKQFGGRTDLALASYNAGELKVQRWVPEREGLDVDEFIDDIPYPETQNYVKRILGAAEEYRRIYGEDGAAPDARLHGAGVPSGRRLVNGSRASRGTASRMAQSSGRKPARVKMSKAPARHQAPARKKRSVS